MLFPFFRMLEHGQPGDQRMEVDLVPRGNASPHRADAQVKGVAGRFLEPAGDAPLAQVRQALAAFLEAGLRAQ